MTGDDDLKNLWGDYGKRLDASLKLNATLLQRSNLEIARNSLRPLILALGLEIAGNAIALVLLGSFIADTFGDARFVIPGVALFISAWLVLVVCARQVVSLKRIDFDEPIVAIQETLERLRLQRIRMNFWLIFAAPLLWVPFMIVGLRAVGVNGYEFGPQYLLSNLALGVALLAVGFIIAKRTTAGSSRFADLLAGRALADARARLDTILRFAEG